MLKVKNVIDTINKLKDRYESLRREIADDFNDDSIDKALPKIEELKLLRKAICDAENLEVEL